MLLDVPRAVRRAGLREAPPGSRTQRLVRSLRPPAHRTRATRLLVSYRTLAARALERFAFTGKTGQKGCLWYRSCSVAARWTRGSIGAQGETSFVELLKRLSEMADAAAAEEGPPTKRQRLNAELSSAELDNICCSICAGRSSIPCRSGGSGGTRIAGRASRKRWRSENRTLPAVASGRAIAIRRGQRRRGGPRAIIARPAIIDRNR